MKGVWVWANDLNPDSYAALREAVVKNKVRFQGFLFGRSQVALNMRRYMAP
jgi:tRNA G37 N-methylase Trm5